MAAGKGADAATSEPWLVGLAAMADGKAGTETGHYRLCKGAQHPTPVTDHPVPGLLVGGVSALQPSQRRQILDIRREVVLGGG